LLHALATDVTKLVNAGHGTDLVNLEQIEIFL
jgi:hypothetical protein